MNKKEQEILDWEFEELLRQIVLGYLKMTGFKMLQFSTSLDTHRETKEIYDITITKRDWNGFSSCENCATPDSEYCENGNKEELGFCGNWQAIESEGD